ncbi:hypothetical protein SB861_63925, partial [Paraburkholderia sp. SIMBA_049]
PSIPFWLGEAPGRSDELSAAVGRLRARLDALFAEGDRNTDAGGRKRGASGAAGDAAGKTTTRGKAKRAAETPAIADSRSDADGTAI